MFKFQMCVDTTHKAIFHILSLSMVKYKPCQGLLLKVRLTLCQFTCSTRMKQSRAVFHISIYVTTINIRNYAVEGDSPLYTSHRHH